MFLLSQTEGRARLIVSLYATIPHIVLAAYKQMSVLSVGFRLTNIPPKYGSLGLKSRMRKVHCQRPRPERTISQSHSAGFMRAGRRCWPGIGGLWWRCRRLRRRRGGGAKERSTQQLITVDPQFGVPLRRLQLPLAYIELKDHDAFTTSPSA